MSNIDLKRFVDINIQKQVEPVIVGTRDTTVLFSYETISQSATYDNNKTTTTTTLTEYTISSYAEAKMVFATANDGYTTRIYVYNGVKYTLTSYANTSDNSLADLLKYCKVYFDNGGSKLYIKYTNKDKLATDVENLDNKYICITCVNNDTDIVAAATTRAANNTIYGINEKLLITRTTDKTFTTSVKNLITKYSSVTGAEMTIAAYLSQIDVYGIDTIYDYAFTQETIAAEDLTDAEYGTLNSNNVNVDIVLANATRNCGGNCTDGADIVNNFVRIILHQTLTDRLLNLLTTKLKNSTGVSKIYTVMTDELEKYKTSGYLTIDKIWTKDTLKIEYNDTAYTIIEQGTPLINGYFVKVLPLSSLTESDKLAHKAPLIYVIIADQYGIRKITINGDVI